MKTRSDFVSNSSSSSFIVRGGEDIPSIFKEHRLTFEEYRTKFFKRDITEEFEYFFSHWGTNEDIKDIRKRVTYMTPEEFISRYSEFKRAACFSELFPVLESDKNLVDIMYGISLEINNLNKPTIEIYRNGKCAENLLWNVRCSIYDIQDQYREEIKKVIEQIEDHFRRILGNTFSNWDFWYAELSDYETSSGKQALLEPQVKWSRVFCNH